MMGSTRLTIGVALAWLMLGGCGSKTATIPEKRYPMEGEVVALDLSAKIATVKAGKIEGWMEAMTMEFPVQPDAEFAALRIGLHIKATVVVQGYKYYLTGIEAVPLPTGK
jgi:Cu/Ag efflux protein CusF